MTFDDPIRPGDVYLAFGSLVFVIAATKPYRFKSFVEQKVTYITIDRIQDSIAWIDGDYDPVARIND